MMTDANHDPRRTDVAEAPPTPDARCQLCGAPHVESDPILCAACGEPVLRWGWAP